MTQPVADTPRRLWPALLAGALAFAVLIGLGSWQVQRLAWKNALIATIDARIASAPVPLAQLVPPGLSAAAQEYRPVRVEGVFDHAAERHFFATHQGASGYFVYTPLRLDDGRYLFVNRGFVPWERKDPATRSEGQVGGRVALVGLLRSAPAEKPSAVLPDNDPGKNVFYWKDVRAMAASAGLPAGAAVLDFFVDADAAPNPGGLPVGGVTIVDLPNNHLQYAITWYGLAAALTGVMSVLVFRRRRQR